MVFFQLNGSAEHLEETLDSLARFGHCAVIGDRDGSSMSINIDTLKRRSLTLSAPVCFDYSEDRPLFYRLARSFFERIQNHAVRPAVETIGLNNAADAHSKMESRQTTGAFVLVPDID